MVLALTKKVKDSKWFSSKEISQHISVKRTILSRVLKNVLLCCP